MPYYNVDYKSLFLTTKEFSYTTNNEQSGASKLKDAIAWLEAVNIYHVWKIIQEWFDLMQDEEQGLLDIHTRNPDPSWNHDDYPDFVPLTQEIADVFIDEMDLDFNLEKARFQGRLAPEFARLPPRVRVAFVQSIYKVMRSLKSLTAEAEERLAFGDLLPPPEDKRGLPQ